MLAHRRVEAASCHTDTRFLGPGIGAAVGITSQLAAPTATLRGGEPPLSMARNLTVRADHPHTHPSYCCGNPCNPYKCHAEGTRRTATSFHCAADLRRGSGWLLESAACHGATLHFTSFRYGLRYG